ncbi:Pre-mRNA-processing ATP-dependent RNA helicase PRP5 [Astathelohania contejeani]|uniref:RNA helicase n=1 Tax=Astathelohania contejeani TaxID=164912 RepID=A0ABQ7I1L3_9MICR|nr:Pre-mRNA-processing ATP-dependent RNA helicase PRP5 [Thelohania contejeani]
MNDPFDEYFINISNDKSMDDINDIISNDEIKYYKENDDIDILDEVKHNQNNNNVIYNDNIIPTPEDFATIKLKNYTSKSILKAHKYRKKYKVNLSGPSNILPFYSFTSCKLPVQIYDHLIASKIKKPTPIQSQTLPILLSGNDILGVAETGSGKTLAFVIPLIKHVLARRNNGHIIALILCPTRELCIQLGESISFYSEGLNISIDTFYGGSSLQQNISSIKRGLDIVVSTPGRLIDLLTLNKGRFMSLSYTTFCVVDEIDRMIDSGFEPQLKSIFNHLRKERQNAFFSATTSWRVDKFARTVSIKLYNVSVGLKNTVCSDVQQRVLLIDPISKPTRLVELISAYSQCLIFVSSKDRADEISLFLIQKGILCNSLHGSKDQSDRTEIIEAFRRGDYKCLVATSVASRGIDIPNLECVINYDCPHQLDEYIHRVGRTGRAGHKGYAYTFVCEEEAKYIPDIYIALRDSGCEISEDLKVFLKEYLMRIEEGEDEMANIRRGRGLERLDGVTRKRKRDILRVNAKETRIKVAEEIAKKINLESGSNK